MVNLLRQGPGVFFLFAAFVPLILISISAPVTRTFYFLEVDGPGPFELRIGSYGYIYRIGADGWRKSSTRLGWDLEQVTDIIPSTGVDFLDNFGDGANLAGAVIKGLTYANVLYPIAAFLALLAILVSLSTSVILDIIGSVIAFLAFLVSAVALACSAALYVTARRRINNILPDDPAHLSNAFWLAVAATILLFLASLTVCFGSCHARRAKRRESAAPRRNSIAGEPTMSEKTHWWQRRKY